MKFDYFIARSHFNRKQWLGANGMTKFSQLLEYCAQYDLVPPDLCPGELFDDRGLPKPKIAKVAGMQRAKEHTDNSNDSSNLKPAVDHQVSQDLADHGVYVDSSEAMKVDSSRKPSRKSRVRTKTPRRGKNAKKD